MNVVLSSIAGSLIGFVVATIVRPPYPFFKFTIVQIGIGTLVMTHESTLFFFLYIWNLA